jgi:hypothetical protein
MFEIIILFAFLYATTCQLFPEGPVTTRSSSKKKYRHGKAKKSVFSLSPQKHLATLKKPVKGKSRNPSYADAA